MQIIKLFLFKAFILYSGLAMASTTPSEECSNLLLRGYRIVSAADQLESRKAMLSEMLQTFGPYAPRALTVDFDESRELGDSQSTRANLWLGVKNGTQKEVRAVLAHEMGHAIFDEFFKIKIRQALNSRRAHHDAYQEEYARGDLDAIRSSEGETRLYEELLGDCLAVFFSRDPGIMADVIKNLVQQDSDEQSRWRAVVRNPLMIYGRSFVSDPGSANFHEDLGKLPPFLRAYYSLTLSRETVWSAILKDSDPTRIPQFIGAFLAATERHLKLGAGLEDLEQFNQTFLKLLFEAFATASI